MNSELRDEVERQSSGKMGCVDLEPQLSLIRTCADRSIIQASKKAKTQTIFVSKKDEELIVHGSVEITSDVVN